MSSEHLQLMIAGYALGDLDPDEAAEFEQLLAHDPAIAAEVDRMQKALELPHLIEVPPPAHLRSAILNAHEQTATLEAAPPALRDPRRSLSPSGAARNGAARNGVSWSRVMNVAAAVAIAVLGINNYHLWRTLQASQTETQRLAALTYSLQGTKAANRASATIAVDPNNLEAVLTVKNLPPLPPGKIYVLWTVLKQNAPFTTDRKSAILTEVFHVDAQGNVSQSIAVPKAFRSPGLVSKVAVSMENAAAPQHHKGTLVMATGL